MELFLSMENVQFLGFLRSKQALVLDYIITDRSTAIPKFNLEIFYRHTILYDSENR